MTLVSDLRDWLSGETSRDIRLDVASAEAAAAVQHANSAPMPIDAAERLEALIKRSWVDLGAFNLPTDLHGAFVRFHKALGFVPKYKSYGTKYATLYGYSLFDLENNGGFSIQTHETDKMEAYHILKARPDSFVLICSVDEWSAQSDNFINAWQAGTPTQSPIAYRAQPGDVITMEQLGTVHTVVGCILEEFATSSYDVVTRLWDQNAGRTCKLPVAHKPVTEVLQEATTLEPQRWVHRRDGHWSQADKGGPPSDEMISLPAHGLFARHLVPGSEDRILIDVPATSLMNIVTLSGRVNIVVNKDIVSLSAGEVTALAPGANIELYGVENSSRISLSEVNLTTAFADLR